MKLIEQIVMHPAVSRGMHQPAAPAIEHLVKLRRGRRDVKRAARNFREEAELGPDRNAYDNGRLMAVPPMPGDKRLRLALAAEGLPDDLRTMIEEWLDAKTI